MKYLLVMISMLIIVLAGCYLWYKWDVNTFKKRLITEYSTTQSTGKDTVTNSKGKFDSSDASNESTSSNELFENSDDKIQEKTNDIETRETDSQSKNESSINRHSHALETTDETIVKESPFGFGRYPKIPEGYPLGVSWYLPDSIFPRYIKRQAELVDRVLIDLYNAGDHEFIAGKWHEGKVYPIYPNTFYVDFHEQEFDLDGDFVIGQTIRTLGPGGTSDIQRKLQNAISVGKTLPGVTVLNTKSHGIDPYEHLSINKN